MGTTFDAELFEWRGPAPYVWVLLPPRAAEHVRDRAAEATYGWGAIPVEATIGGTTWETSLLPRGESYVLPVKLAVRKAEGLELDDPVTVELEVVTRGGKRAGTLGEGS